MGTHYKGLHGEAPPDMITFFRLQVHIYENVGISGGWGGGGYSLRWTNREGSARKGYLFHASGI